MNDFSFSADGEELPDLCFIPVYTFFVVNIDLPSKHPVKESHDNVRQAFVHTELVPGLNPAMLLGH